MHGSNCVQENNAGHSSLREAHAKERLERAGNEFVKSPPEEFVSFVRTETAKWTRVVK